MNREELTELLETVAEVDLEDGHDIFDHPCSVAVRAINQCFKDIDTLRRVSSPTSLKSKGRSKRVQTLIRLPYNPKW